ncbi:hypothetical protein ABEB36_014390 [Hypothenemus hampei]|uniref:Reverse transcriptase domain-containing protein n=1 Tax=Hypothenemus hampei TaxID=57062 RepID=A0ABD1E8U5_HYPHA
MVDWMASTGLVVVNTGSTPTFSRAGKGSVIDVTVASPNVCGKIIGWTVEEMENYSDHKYITYSFEDGSKDRLDDGSSHRSWVYSARRSEEFKRELRGKLQNLNEINPYSIQKCLRDVCNKYFKQSGQGRRRVYWWNGEIAGLRAMCNKSRRLVTRNRKKPGISKMVLEVLHAKYKKAKSDLKKAIRSSKRRAWCELCDELDENVWGTAYKIVKKRWGYSKTYLDGATIRLQVEKLFPSGDELEAVDHGCRAPVVPFFTEAEMLAASGRLKARRAPGPDGVVPEIIRDAVDGCRASFLTLFNKLLDEGTFPEGWKEATLVLVEKQGKTKDAPKTYRPICLVNTLAKLFEVMLNERLRDCLEVGEALHQAQFGFRRGRSVMGPLARLRDTVDIWNKKSYKSRGCCIAVLLDIENAFNNASWKEIMKGLDRCGVPMYLKTMISSYLSRRHIIVEGKRHRVTRGVPQGSVLGPTLWNVLYDRVLRLPMEENTYLLAYADDLAVVVSGPTADGVEDLAEKTVRRVRARLTEMGLSLAISKTEVILLAARRVVRGVSLQIGGEIIESSEFARYLGVYIDRGMKMSTHVNVLSKKCHAIINTLMRIMPRRAGPRQGARALIASTVTSTMLFAAPIWSGILKHKHYRDLLNGVLRRVCILVTRSYRTVSTEAVLVMARIAPVELLAEERRKIHGIGADDRAGRLTAREELLSAWQERWSRYEGWAKTMIPSICGWYKNGAQTDYYVTQALTGHGIFGKYLHKIGKAESAACWYCGGIDDAEHTIFECPQFTEIRRAAGNRCGVALTKENIGNFISENKEKQEHIFDMLRELMTVKEKTESERNNILTLLT